jgi:hypothetical protein
MRQRRESPFEAWEGQSYVGASISYDLKNNDSDYLSCDYSKFDQTQSPELINRVGNDLVHPMVMNAKPRMWENWLSNLTEGELITPDRVYTGKHGMPSGSVATNFLDSIHNALCIEGYLANYNIRNSRYWVQGDDAVIRGRGVDPKDFAEFASSVYGFNAHPDKQLFGHNEVDFLQYSYYVENDYKPTYPVSRVGWRTIGHERFSFEGKDWNQWAAIVRCLQQMNNAIDNPSVDGLIRWAAKGDAYRLGAEYPPNFVFKKAGKAGKALTAEKSRYTPGAMQAWDILPIQAEVRRVISED